VAEQAIQAALAHSVHDVLEKMFFAELVEEAGKDAPAPRGIAAELAFEGDPPGSFRLDLDLLAAQAAAADFLGEDACEINAGQMNAVVCELANMICGSVLSRIESSATFRLAKPEIAGEIPFGAAGPPDSAYQATLGGGALRAEIRMERPVCPEIDESAS
jgi:CheY-specific phosphatase CheX